MLDLNNITINDQLAQQIPFVLSRYYLALPIGRENGRVSVAMAHPENEKARQVLARLLQAEIVPVFVPEQQLRERLAGLPSAGRSPSRQVLAWYGRPEWESAVTNTATTLGDTLQTMTTLLTANELTLSEVVALAAAGSYALTVCPLPDQALLPTLLSESHTSLYFVRGELQPLRRILLVMRGFASDERALEWLLPFALHHEATITLMPLLDGRGIDLNGYYRQDSYAAQHLARCAQRLLTAGVSVDLKFRQGPAELQVAEELSGNEYDLLALAAEGEGNFVCQVLTAVEEHQAHHGRPIFVLKPPELPAQTNGQTNHPNQHQENP